MPKRISPPMFVARRLCWDIAGDGPETTFWVSSTTFKYALGLRPRATADDRKAESLAKKNWAVLELIARDALETGRVTTDASKGWKVNHEIDDATFRELFNKYASHIVE